MCLIGSPAAPETRHSFIDEAKMPWRCTIADRRLLGLFGFRLTTFVRHLFLACMIKLLTCIVAAFYCSAPRHRTSTPMSSWQSARGSFCCVYVKGYFRHTIMWNFWSAHWS